MWTAKQLEYKKELQRVKKFKKKEKQEFAQQALIKYRAEVQAAEQLAQKQGEEEQLKVDKRFPTEGLWPLQKMLLHRNMPNKCRKFKRIYITKE